VSPAGSTLGARLSSPRTSFLLGGRSQLRQFAKFGFFKLHFGNQQQLEKLERTPDENRGSRNRNAQLGYVSARQTTGGREQPPENIAPPRFIRQRNA